MSNISRQQRPKTNDPLRPSFHFTAPNNWLNDPNGLIQWKGTYHLFYQHNPSDSEWGLIHWGHAVSDDLVHWQDMPIALTPTPDSYDEAGVWSGCLVDDDGVATILYTGVRGGVYEHQTLCIATSTDDDLARWQKYEGNPITIDMPQDLTYSGFRDPYVWKQDGLWKMVIGAGAKDGCETVLLYEGETLYNWRYVSPLYMNADKNDYVYECPNFFQLGDKWVMIVSIMPTSHVEYVVGLFWNNHFIPESHGKLGNYPLYAPLTFLDENNRRLMIGWLQETQSDDLTKQSDWAGAMSLPMELMLLDNNQLAITPVTEILDSQLPSDYQQFHNVTVDDLVDIQSNLASKRLKVVVSDDLSKVIFIDGSVVEYFNFPDYTVRRIYEYGADLTTIADFVDFPQKRIGVWIMPDTL
ncbi:MAG: hypothetical protein Phog2KO_04340 [Phototrophicaceae bacterium]